MNKLFALVFAVFLLLSVASAASLNFVSPTPSNGATVSSGTIDYDAELVAVDPAKVVDFDVVLYTSSYAYVAGDNDYSQVTSVEGSFMSLEDGNYILYAGATFDDGTTEVSLVRFEIDREISVDNPLSVRYADPTPLNGTVVNYNSLDSTFIVAVADEVVDEMTIIYLNESGDEIADSQLTDEKESEVPIRELWEQFGDGVYSFYTTVTDDGFSAETEVRTIRIKATLPNATDIEIIALPESVNENAQFSFGANLTVSEQPVKVRMVATKALSSKVLGSHDLTNYSGEILGFTSSIAESGQYEIALVVSDSYGNSNRYALSNITVNDVAEPTEERRRGGRSSNNDDEVAAPTSRFNLTLVDTNDNEEEPTEETTEETEENPGFFSFITGAVTGAFSTPPRAVLTFIILVVIIYAIIKIRGYVVADDEKPKKNGKKNGKKEKVDEEESQEE